MKLKLGCLLGLNFILSAGLGADNLKSKFAGDAKENGITVYTENHEILRDANGNMLEAETTYTDPSGKILGTLRSDFRESQSLPADVFTDARTKNQYGVRRRNGEVLMFRRAEGKAEEIKAVEINSDPTRLVIGGQGFIYYLKDGLDQLKKLKKQPIVLLIPGDLSNYKFVIEFLRDNPDQTVDIQVQIENWWLRAFAPKLQFSYSPSLGRIVRYKGISNLKNDAGKNMSVNIEYH